MRDIFKLLISVGFPLLIGFLGSFFTASSVSTWYVTLNKPSFNPPNWVFGPVWTVLYILMGISLFLVWKSDNRLAFILFGVQLGLNLLWSLLFFGLQQPFFAFIEIVLLWGAIIATIIVFYSISRIAALLLVPYILWVTFAAILNFMIYWLN